MWCLVAGFLALVLTGLFWGSGFDWGLGKPTDENPDERASNALAGQKYIHMLNMTSVEDQLEVLEKAVGILERALEKSEQPGLQLHAQTSCRNKLGENTLGSADLDDWVRKQCHGFGPSSTCHGLITQDLQHYGLFKNQQIAGASFTAENIYAAMHIASRLGDDMMLKRSRYNKLAKLLKQQGWVGTIGHLGPMMLHELRQAEALVADDRMQVFSLDLHSMGWSEERCTCFEMHMPQWLWRATPAWDGVGLWSEVIPGFQSRRLRRRSKGDPVVAKAADSIVGDFQEAMSVDFADNLPNTKQPDITDIVLGDIFFAHMNASTDSNHTLGNKSHTSRDVSRLVQDDLDIQKYVGKHGDLFRQLLAAELTVGRYALRFPWLTLLYLYSYPITSSTMEPLCDSGPTAGFLPRPPPAEPYVDLGIPDTVETDTSVDGILVFSCHPCWRCSRGPLARPNCWTFWALSGLYPLLEALASLPLVGGIVTLPFLVYNAWMLPFGLPASQQNCLLSSNPWVSRVGAQLGVPVPYVDSTLQLNVIASTESFCPGGYLPLSSPAGSCGMDTLQKLPCSCSAAMLPERTCSGRHPCASCQLDAGANNEWLSVYDPSHDRDLHEALLLAVLLEGELSGYEWKKLYKSMPHEDLNGSFVDQLVSMRNASNASPTGSDDSNMLLGVNTVVNSQKFGRTLSEQSGDASKCDPDVLVRLGDAGQAYDKRLAGLLLLMQHKEVHFDQASLFSTQLSQLRLMGINLPNHGGPPMAEPEHYGIILRLATPASFELKGCRKWQFLVLELMADGLLWTLSVEFPSYDFKTLRRMDFDVFQPVQLAGFLAAHHDIPYAVGNFDCRFFASALGDEIAAHAKRWLEVVEVRVVGRPGASVDKLFPRKAGVAMMKYEHRSQTVESLMLSQWFSASPHFLNASAPFTSIELAKVVLAGPPGEVEPFLQHLSQEQPKPELMIGSPRSLGNHLLAGVTAYDEDLPEFSPPLLARHFFILLPCLILLALALGYFLGHTLWRLGCRCWKEVRSLSAPTQVAIGLAFVVGLGPWLVLPYGLWRMSCSGNPSEKQSEYTTAGTGDDLDDETTRADTAEAESDPEDKGGGPSKLIRCNGKFCLAAPKP